MFDNVTNKDDARRHEIIESCGGIIMDGWSDSKGYDIKYYEGLTAAGLDTLIKEGFADEDEQQNSCPCIRAIYKFIHEHPHFTAHGYIVTPRRADYRVSIEGVTGEECNAEDIHDFVEMFRRADDFIIEGGHCHCWFD